MKRNHQKIASLLVFIFLSGSVMSQFPKKYIAAITEVSKLTMLMDEEEITEAKTISDFKRETRNGIFWNENETEIDIAITEIHFLSETSAKVVYNDSSSNYEVIKKGDLLILQSFDTIESARELLDPLVKHWPINYKEGKTPLNKKQYTFRPCIYLTIEKGDLHYPIVSYRKKTIGKRFSSDHVIGAENNQLNKSALNKLKKDENEDWFLYQEKVVVFKLK